MDWMDTLIKIGVGACLGFGIIALAKLARSKIDQEQKRSEGEHGRAGQSDDSGTTSDGR